MILNFSTKLSVNKFNQYMILLLTAEAMCQNLSQIVSFLLLMLTYNNY